MFVAVWLTAAPMCSENVVLALSLPPTSLEAKLWVANSGRDELVGSHTKDLRSERDDKRHRLDESSTWTQSAHWLDLTDAKGKQAGRVQLALDWHASSAAGFRDETTVCPQYLSHQCVRDPLARCRVSV